MDQMLEQITEAAKRVKTFSEDELTQLAAYLVGQIPLERIAPILPTTRNNVYYSSFSRHTAEIVRACQEQPGLLPRLGRHLAVLRQMNPSAFLQAVGRMSGDGPNALSLVQIFLDSGLGAQALLVYLFEQNYSACPEELYHLDYLYEHHPGEIETYLEADDCLQRMGPLSYLCARLGEDIYADAPETRGLLQKLAQRKGKPGSYGKRLTKLTRQAFAASFQSRPQAAQKAFREELLARLPAAAEVLAHGADKGLVGVYTKRRVGSVDHYLAHAIALAGARLPHLNRMTAAACMAAPEELLDSLYPTLPASQAREAFDFLHARYNQGPGQETTDAIVSQLGEMETICSAFGAGREAVCVWAMGKTVFRPECWCEAFAKQYGGDAELLAGAARYAPAYLKAPLLRMRCALTGSLEQAAAGSCAEAFASTLSGVCERAEIERVAAFLRDGAGELAALPDLDAFYKHTIRPYLVPNHSFDPDLAIWSLAGVHPIAERYLAFLAEKGYAVGIELCANYLVRFLGMAPASVADWLSAHAEPARLLVLLACLDRVRSAQAQMPVRQVFHALCAAFPAAAAAAFGEKGAGADFRLFLLEALYQAQPDYDTEFLIGCLEDGSKKVQQYAVSLLMPKKELIERIRPLLDAKKKALREAAEQLMTAYEGEDIREDAADLLGLCTRLLPKSGANSIKWAIPGNLPLVRWADSADKADDTVVKCYLFLMLGGKTIDLPAGAQPIREALCEDDLHAVASQVYGQWIADGAPAKQKAALLLFGVHATDADVLLLQKQIEDWASHSRGAIASEAVRAMAMGGSSLALMTVDSMGRKFKNKQVRRAAQAAFTAAATALGTTPETLGDKIIPTLGFDERGERVVDYGTRSFTAYIAPSLAVELRDGAGKKIKNLPKPGAKDDTEKAEKAKAEFTALKKSLKAVVTTQAQRLETALATGRRWDSDGWRALFVENPIMHSFAIGLVWGIFEGDALTSSFRYMEDGSFTDMDEDDFDFAGAKDRSIGLLHPLDLDEEALAQWRQQLEDYEIVQPFPQLARAVYRLEEAEREALALDRFGGKRMLGITLMNKLQKSGWYKGSVQDAGVFYTFYREIGAVGIQLYFSGMYVSPDLTESVTLGQAGFYRAGSVQRGSYVYDDVKKDEIIPLAEVSPRMFSEVVLDLTLATATSAEQDEGWKGERELLFFAGK